MTTYEPELIDVAAGDDVTDLFEARGLGDGLPLVAPTPERVAAMLEHATGDPDEVLFTLQPRAGMVTRRVVAINAVMAGCRPDVFPVVLTALSAILGVLPIAFGLGLEIFHHETTINAPSTQWWISLSSAIVFGLSFATLLTLVVTPAMLMVFTREKHRKGERSWWGRLFRRGKQAKETAPAAAEPGAPAEAFPKAAE